MDLDLDLVGREGSWIVVDEDEFKTNRVNMGYPCKLAQSALKQLKALKVRSEQGDFPFDGTMLEHINRVREKSSGFTV